MTTHTAKPELLAPAGDWECVRAAVANGADAIYFGLPRFNARLRAENFTEDDLPRLMDYLHARGVRGYVAFNTLIFTDELPAAEAQLRLLQRCRVDAAIVQDLGLVALAREVAPDVEIHASTQMTLTSPEGVRFARRLGIARVVLARELSLRELAKFREPDTGAAILPTEVFVHGALCVAYSGQCLTSEALGQRSANRGECAQACRLPYDLIVDGERHDLGDRRYLLSPQDLAAVNEIPELIRLGVQSFKIEGRLKSPEYVAAVTKVYRRAIDAAVPSEGRPPCRPPSLAVAPLPNTADDPAVVPPGNAADRYALEMTFSRGQFTGWLHGVDHQRLVHGRFGKKRGVDLGRVARVARDAVELFLTADGFPSKPGDGVVFDTGEDTDHEQGGRIFAVRGNRLEFERGRLDARRIPVGARVWKTSDPALDATLRATFAKDPPPRRRPLDLRVAGRAGEPLRVTAPEFPGVAETVSEIPLVPARTRPLTAETLREQLGRLGETAWELRGLDCDALDGALMLPVSELNRLRRELVDQLPRTDDLRVVPDVAFPTGKIARPASWARSPLNHRSSDIDHGSEATPGTTRRSSVRVLCRTLPQIEAALAVGNVATIYADFEDIRRYKDAVALVRTAAGPDAPAIFLATPRIQKAGEHGFFRLIETAAPDGVLVRNLGALDYFRESPLRRVGDFSLNVANPLTADVLLQAGGFERLTVSPDLNAPQVLDLLRACPPGTFEITVHQHLPMFHMEHCVFAAFLSEGKDHLTCGRPCDRHEVKLRDRVGAEHPVKADVGCRNTVFQSRAQSGAEFVRDFREAGAGSFRVELLAEDRAGAERVIRLYAALLSGETGADDVIGRLRVNAQLGVTRGTLAVAR